MSEYFEYDVFLSYSSKDKEVVRDLAGRLRADGVKVWFDEWMIKPGDSIPSMIERGLETSRTLVLCMSKHAFASDWSKLESYTFRFRDPLNKSRRFIPVRLDDQEAPGSLAQFLYVDWRGTNTTDRDAEYKKFLTSVGGHGRPKTAPPQVASRAISLGHTDSIRSVALSPDGRSCISASYDRTIRMWDAITGEPTLILEGHTDTVWTASWSDDGRQIISGSLDGTIRIWDASTGVCTDEVSGLGGGVVGAAFLTGEHHLVSATTSGRILLHELDTGLTTCRYEFFDNSLTALACNATREQAVLSCSDGSIRILKLDFEFEQRLLGRHIGPANAVDWSQDGRRAASADNAGIIKIWDTLTGECLAEFASNQDRIWCVSWNHAGTLLISTGSDGTLAVWDTLSPKCLSSTFVAKHSLFSAKWSPDDSAILVGSDIGSLTLLDTSSMSVLWQKDSLGIGGAVVALDAGAKGAVAVGSHQVLHTWDLDNPKASSTQSVMVDNREAIYWSPDKRTIILGGFDGSIVLVDQNSNEQHLFEGKHEHRISSIDFCPRTGLVASASYDGQVRLWDVSTRSSVKVLTGQTQGISCVAMSPDGDFLASASLDGSCWLWELSTWQIKYSFHFGGQQMLRVAWSPSGNHIASATSDSIVRVLDIDNSVNYHLLEGHRAAVASLAWSEDGLNLASGDESGTLRVWNPTTGKLLYELQGHACQICSLRWSQDGRHLTSASTNGVVRVWDLRDVSVSLGTNTSQVQYTNAKVLLVGDSSAGKTGLSKRLSSGIWEPSDSTVGAWATQWKLDASKADGVTREIWLWDFGGQADQRLIHQLYMEETSLAVLVFDGQREDFFDSLSQWDRDLHRASRKPFKKLLAAGRVDAGGLRVSRAQVEKFASEKEFCGFIETSAKENLGCDDLKTAILDGIDWDAIPCRTTDRIFKLLKDEIIRLKDEGRVLMRINELRAALQLRMSEPVEEDDLRAVLTLLAGPGVVIELAFGSFVLLQPERINAYAQAVIRTLQADEHERGFLKEELVLAGELNYSASMERLSDPEEERFILLAMHQTFVSRALCFRLQSDKGTLLVFPSYFRQDRPEIVEHPSVLVNYHFTGFLDEIYATLVVRLHHTTAFTQDQLWRNAADFKTNTKKQVGIKLTRRGPGEGDLQVYFDADVPEEERILFSLYVQEHLKQYASDITRFRHYFCENCATSVGNRDVARKRLQNWLPTKMGNPPTIICVECEKRIELWDELEEYFLSPELNKKVRDLEREADVVLDAESKERVLVGEVISTVALAAQISRELTVSDHGIDMEIEFKDDKHRATAAKVYLQLKSGDSYLYERVSDGEEVFRIKEDRHAEYWMNHAYPVFLVHRSSEGEVRWMRIDDYLRRESDNGKKEVKQIVFEGERLDVMSVRQWRDKLLADRKKS